MTAPAASMGCFAVVLTGGIASGKSTVQKLFEGLGCTVLDADLIARELVAPGQPSLAEIVATFGADMLSAQGELDRQRMRELVFSDAGAKHRLEQILHPRIRAELLSRARASTGPYCMLAIPLFAESMHAYRWVDRVLVVDVPSEIQIQRLMQRDGMTVEFAERALAAQASRGERLSLANDVVDNAGASENLPPMVNRLHRLYLETSDKRRRDG